MLKKTDCKCFLSFFSFCDTVLYCISVLYYFQVQYKLLSPCMLLLLFAQNVCNTTTYFLLTLVFIPFLLGYLFMILVYYVMLFVV